MQLQILKSNIKNGHYKKTFSVMYGCEQVAEQEQRYYNAVSAFADAFDVNGEQEVALYSAPGRVELIGNHTDHQRGKVVAASIHLDALAVVKAEKNPVIRIQSVGHGEECINLSDVSTLPSSGEKNSMASLVKGIAAYFKSQGYSIGGFTAYITSNVLTGSGMSSSAAFETLVGTILNHEYNESRISAVDIAKAGQYAENVYFGKPCGLMDQTAASVGNTVAIDFFDISNPKIEVLEMPLESNQHTLCIIDTGGSHADLTHEYAMLPHEMKAVAQFFGKEVLSQVTETEFTNNIAAVRKAVGDRAVLRAIHYFDEDKRVLAFCDALRAKNLYSCMLLLRESGMSSFKYLQNIYSESNSREQSLSIALAIAEKALANQGAYRVHGGGFSGTILAIVPNDRLAIFEQRICQVFGGESCHKMYMRPMGAIAVKASL